MEQVVAEKMGVSVDVYNGVFDVEDRIKAQKGEISTQDWEFISDCASKKPLEIRANALMSIAALKPTSPHRYDAIKLANQYINESPLDGALCAIFVLRKFGDQSYKRHLQRFIDSPDPNTSEIGRRMKERFEEQDRKKQS